MSYFNNFLKIDLKLITCNMCESRLDQNHELFKINPNNLPCKPNCCNRCFCFNEMKKKCHYCRNWNHNDTCCLQRPERGDHFDNKYVCFGCKICWKSKMTVKLCDHFGYNGYKSQWSSSDNFYNYYRDNIQNTIEGQLSKMNCKNCKYDKRKDLEYGEKYPEPKCRNCGKLGIVIGRDFRAPPFKNTKEWDHCKYLYYIDVKPRIGRLKKWFVQNEHLNAQYHNLGKGLIILLDEWRKMPFEYCAKLFNYSGLSTTYNKEELNDRFSSTKLAPQIRWAFVKQFIRFNGIISYWRKCVYKSRHSRVMNQLLITPPIGCFNGGLDYIKAKEQFEVRRSKIL